MLVIEELTYKNFLATGAEPIVITFNKSNATLVTGTNGVGKSTFLDAINFVFFNKAFRKVKKGQLVNSINGKKMVVEAKFSSNGKSYRIVRGVKPAIFEIYENGDLIDQEAATKDYQKTLETQILKLNYNTFNNVVILGSASYVPFMQLVPSDRREVIEDILDIKVFGAMSDILKTKMAATEAATAEKTIEVDLCRTKIESQTKVVDMATHRLTDLKAAAKTLEDGRCNLLKERLRVKDQGLRDLDDQIVRNTGLRDDYVKGFNVLREGRIKLHNEEAESLTSEMGDLHVQITGLIPVIAALKDDSADLDKAEAALGQARTMQTKATTTIDHLTEQAGFFRDNDVCPSCAQDITHDHKEDVALKYGEKIASQRSTLAPVEDAIKYLESEVAKRAELQAEITSKSSALALAEGRVKTIKKRASQLVEFLAKEAAEEINTAAFDGDEKTLRLKKAHLQDAEVNVDDLNANIAKAEGDIDLADNTVRSEEFDLATLNNHRDTLTEEYGALLDLRVIEDAAKTLLKDNGIKTAVIHEYLPSINSLINKFLAAMDFFVSFELDEGFNEVIKSRGRDEFSYASFSEGEKRRIDLAILFTWRQIAQMKNSVNVNLLILDEILDGSLDAVGIEKFMTIMSDLGDDNNIFVISHRDIVDGFDTYLRFEKRGDFSTLIEE